VTRPLSVLAAAIPLAAASCSLAHFNSSPVRIGGSWERAEHRLIAWASSRSGRSYQVQDLERSPKRIYPPLDSLIIADAYRRAGLNHPMLRGLPPAPKKACVLCRENYIFYVRGNQIVGVEYRAVESDGWGGYRQQDETVGEVCEAPLTKS